MPVIYILKSLKNYQTYTGWSSNLTQRFTDHNQGKVHATKHQRPFELLFTEEVASIQEAKKRECYWKSGAGRRKMKKLFAR